METSISTHFNMEELVEGARRDPEFQSRLRVMDIDEADLKQWLGPGLGVMWRRWTMGTGVYIPCSPCYWTR